METGGGPGAQGWDPAGAVVLVVDASSFFRESIRDALAEAGHASRAAADWEEAAAALEDPALALVVADLAGGGEGAEGGERAVAALRALHAARPAVRSIVLASRGGQDRVIEALRAGASDYLAKPLHEEELLLSVERALAGWAADVELARLRAAAPAVPGKAADAAVAAPAVAGEDGAEGDADLELARALCAAVASDRDPDGVVAELLRAVAARCEAAPVSLYLRDPSTGDCVRQAEWDGGRRGDRPRLAADRGLSGACLATGQIVAVPDPTADPRFDAVADTPEDGDAGPLLCLPIRIRGRTLGLVRAFLPPGREPSLRTAEVASAACSAAVRTVLLYRSWLSGVEEVARIRREAARPGPAPAPPARPPES